MPENHTRLFGPVSVSATWHTFFCHATHVFALADQRIIDSSLADFHIIIVVTVPFIPSPI